MRTNIEIDDDLMRQAQQIAGTRTKRETVDFALRELVARRNRMKILDLRGNFEWIGNLDDSRTDRAFE